MSSCEYRFLRRRHKFLLKSKSTTTSQQVKSHNLETTQFRKSKKENVHPKKAKTLHNLPPIHNLNQRGRVYTEKKNVNPGRPPHGDKNVNLHSVNMSPVTEFNRKENGFGGKEARVPIFDLNQISVSQKVKWVYMNFFLFLNVERTQDTFYKFVYFFLFVCRDNILSTK